MTREIDKATALPARLGEFEILRELTPGQSFEALDGAGRHVVLKRLATDCMLGGGLHPHVRDRLSRVRELAHPGVANLFGVEATEWGEMLVWEFVPGRTLEDMAGDLASRAGSTGSPQAGSMNSPRADLLKLAEEVLLSVQSLHGLGIVHGGLHGRNIIVDSRPGVKLTHISPLLYDDPKQDAQDVAATIGAIAAARGWDQEIWEKLRVDAQERGLAGMRTRLTAAMEDRSMSAATGKAPEARRRRRLVAGAVASTAVGLALAGGVIAYEVRSRPPIPVPPRVAPAADSTDSTDSSQADQGDASGAGSADNPEAPVGQ